MPIKECDILIQAGHENTPDDKTGGSGPLGNEIDWTPIVTNEAVVLLGTLIESRKENEHLRGCLKSPDSRKILSSMCLLQLPESWHEACSTSTRGSEPGTCLIPCDEGRYFLFRNRVGL